MNQSRIKHQFNNITQEPLDGISVSLDQNNYLKWTGILIGPQNSLYQQGIFSFQVIFPQNYPFSTPQIHFLTPIYHPNIQKGNIKNKLFPSCGCKGICGREWSASIKIRQILTMISSALKQPISQSQCVDDKTIIKQFVKKRQDFDKKARLWTETYAKM